MGEKAGWGRVDDMRRLLEFSEKSTLFRHICERNNFGNWVMGDSNQLVRSRCDSGLERMATEYCGISSAKEQITKGSDR